LAGKWTTKEAFVDFRNQRRLSAFSFADDRYRRRRSLTKQFICFFDRQQVAARKPYPIQVCIGLEFRPGLLENVNVTVFCGVGHSICPRRCS
jgi:hypothetical protein